MTKWTTVTVGPAAAAERACAAAAEAGLGGESAGGCAAQAELALSSIAGAAAAEQGSPKAANKSSTSALDNSVRAVT